MEQKFYQSNKVSHSFTISNGSLKKQASFRNQILRSSEKKRRKRMIRAISPKRIFKFGKGAGGDNSAFQQMMR